MATYTEILDELRTAGVTPYNNGEFYDFAGWPLEDQFSQFRDFAQIFLDRDDVPYNIRPARIYFNTNTRLNACARPLNHGYRLIEINKGTILRLHPFFLDKEHLFNQEAFIRYRGAAQTAGITPAYFLFQMATLFFLYHETGHLIQQAGNAVDQLEFLQDDCVGDAVRIQHMRELDADAFACHNLAMHVVQFAERQTPQGPEVDQVLLREGAALALAGIYMFFVYRSEAHIELYLAEHCHPHPLVRLSYCVIFLLENLQGNVTEPINPRLMLNNAIQLSEHLMRTPDGNPIEAHSLALANHIADIEAYIQQIINNTHTYPHLTVHLVPVQ